MCRVCLCVGVYRTGARTRVYARDDYGDVRNDLCNEQSVFVCWCVGLEPVPEYMLETIMETLEMTCYDNMQKVKKNTVGLGVEFDENSTCNVCQSVRPRLVSLVIRALAQIPYRGVLPMLDRSDKSYPNCLSKSTMQLYSLTNFNSLVIDVRLPVKFRGIAYRFP